MFSIHPDIPDIPVQFSKFTKYLSFWLLTYRFQLLLSRSLFPISHSHSSLLFTVHSLLSVSHCSTLLTVHYGNSYLICHSRRHTSHSSLFTAQYSVIFALLTPATTYSKFLTYHSLPPSLPSFFTDYTT